MKILVCISNVPDTTTKIKLTDDSKSIDQTGTQWIINPWDELSLTRALELKESSGGIIEKVNVICVGNVSVEPTIRKALAIGADEAIRINTDAKDAYYVANQLAAVIKNDPYDIILCGIESSDYNGSAVGGMLSECLSIPSISSVSGIIIQGNELTINREIDGGKEVLSTTLPLIAIVQKGIAINPRIAAMRGIMQARTKPIKIIEPIVVDLLTQEVKLELPATKSACKMIAEDNIQELVNLLQNEAKVI